MNGYIIQDGILNIYRFVAVSSFVSIDTITTRFSFMFILLFKSLPLRNPHETPLTRGCYIPRDPSRSAILTSACSTKISHDSSSTSFF